MLRVWLSFAFPSYDHDDEIFQATEQAHRLVFGYGVIPWEFVQGARSWLLPGLTAIVLAPAGWISGSPASYLGAVSLEFAALALLPVWAAWDIGRRFGTNAAICAAFAVAAGLGLAEQSIRTLSEIVGADLLLPGIALATGIPTRRRMILAGLAFGTAVAFRFHLAPGAAVAAALGCQLEWRRRWLPLVLAGLIPIAVLGLVDWATWGAPFASIITNVVRNLGGQTDIYGTSPPQEYLTEIADRYGVALFLLVPLMLIGAWRAPALLCCAVVLLILHSAIPHKEYRFVYPAMLCLIVLVGLGMGICVAWLRGRTRSDLIDAAVLPAALGLIAIAALAASLAPEARASLFLHRNAILAFRDLHDDPSVCGIAFAGDAVYEFPGYAGLHRNVPFYLWASLKAAQRRDAVNVVVSQIASPAPNPLPVGTTCYDTGGIAADCVVRLANACRPAPQLEISNDPRWAGHTR